MKIITLLIFLLLSLLFCNTSCTKQSAQIKQATSNPVILKISMAMQSGDTINVSKVIIVK